MAQNILLKRSAIAGKTPDTGSLQLGELAINTYDGKIHFKKSGSVESIEGIVTTNSQVTGSIRITETGSFGSLRVNDTLTINHGEAIISGSALVTNDLTILGAVNARQFNISIISSSVLFESGSSKFGNTSDDIHQFTGSVEVTGSLYLNGIDLSQGNNSGSFSGSFQGDGSGLRGVVSDDIPRDGWDYNSNSSASISEFNITSSKYLIDFQWEQEVGTPIGFKTFISNTTGSTQIVPTTEGIKFIVGNELVATVGAEGITATIPSGVVSSSAQLTSSYDSRYVLSGSITQTTWDNIENKPNNIISSSTQISNLGYAITGSNTFKGTQTMSGSIIPAIDNTYDLGSLEYQWRDIFVSSGSLYIDGTKVLSSTGNELQITTDAGQSIKILEAGSDSIILQSADGDIQLKSSGGGNLLFDPTTGLIDVRGTLQIQNGNKITSSDGNAIQFGNNIGITGSIVSTTTPLVSGSSQIDLTQTTGYSTFSTSVNSRVANFESNSGTYATTGSNTFIGTQTITGSLFVSSNLIVQGSSSLQNITASAVSIGTNIVNLNTANPAIRYAGLVIGDSGSVGGSGSFLYDSVQDEMLFIHRGDSSVVTSSVALMGPETYDNLGNEIYLTNNRLPKGTGKEHLVDSNITDSGTLITLGSNTSISGTLVAGGTPLVSGSSQITLSATTGYGSVLNQAVLTSSSPTFVAVSATTFTGALSGNASTVTNGVYTTGDQTIGGVKTFNGTHLAIENGTNVWKYIRLRTGGTIRWDIATNEADDNSSLQFRPGGNSENRVTISQSGNILPGANGTQNLGSSSLRWNTIFTSDLSLSNGIGDWTIVEGEDDLFLYNNKKEKVYKFALTEVDPSVATPKKS
jgi:hypothetical protein